MNMKHYLPFKSRYDKFPTTSIAGHSAYQGYESLIKELSNGLKKARVTCFEMYPGVDEKEVRTNLIDKLGFEEIYDISKCAKPIKDIDKMIQLFLTDDRIFGIMSKFLIEAFYDLKKLVS